MNLKLSGIGLVAITAVLLLPSSFSTEDTNKLNFWGIASLVTYDSEGNEVFAQQIHNRIVDTGEDLILDQVFQDAASDIDNNQQVATICAFENSSSPDVPVVSIQEEVTALQFDEDNAIVSDDRCIEDDVVVTTSGTAVIGALTFLGGTNVADGDTIHGIGICQAVDGNGTYRSCDVQGVLFAIIDTSDVTLNTGETVDITYTFDITSDDD